MGVDQSTLTSAPLKSQRDEDIPYTSCSISKPIGSDASRSSPSLASIPAKVVRSAESRNQQRRIVVVAEGQPSGPVIDTEIQRLSSLPAFTPLLLSTVTSQLGTVSSYGADDTVSSRPPQLDARHVLALCARYQDHLHQCAEAIAFDQNALCVRIKEVDFAAQSLYSSLTEQQKKFAHCAEQIQKVSEISSTLNRIHQTIEQTVPLMQRLNSVLPDNEQLEPFSFTDSTT